MLFCNLCLVVVLTHLCFNNYVYTITIVTPPQRCMVGSIWFLSGQMQRHCYPENMASALTSQLHYHRLTLSCPIIVVVYLVCDNNNISFSFSMYSCILLYLILMSN